MNKRKLLLLLLGSALVGYAYWRSQIGFSGERLPLTIEGTEEIGERSDKGNLIALQPFLTPADYSSREAFEEKIGFYLEQARQKGWLTPKTIIALPEYTGTWLVAIDEKGSVYSAKDIDSAMSLLVLRHPLSFFWFWLNSSEREPTRAALFRTKAHAMAEAYQETFSSLSARYGVTIVAGSIVLPAPAVTPDGALSIDTSGPLYNVAAVFNADGKLQGIVKKVFLIEDEKPFLGAAPVDELPIFETPAGRLGVLICADSWYPASYDQLQKKGATLLAVLSYSSSDGLWDTPWGGYNGAEAPADVDLKDVKALTEGEAWSKYAMPGRAPKSGVLVGVSVFLRGHFWDLGSDGHTLALSQGKLSLSKFQEGASLTNVWVP